MEELLPAGTIISHYRILSRLSAGGMGEVYLAEDIRLGRQVALKFLPASYQYDPDRHSRFLKEARAASALRSPHIAAIYDIGEYNDYIFIVMEYVEGESLSVRLKRGPLAVRDAIDSTLQVADALSEAHSFGIVHCDIKTSNIIVNERGLAKILDFGIARVAEAEDEDVDSDRTQKVGRGTAFGVVLGTVSYMSPEQALGRGVDHRSDIFSLGVVIYEMLAARLPFEGDSPTDILDNILHLEPPSISRFNYSVPPELERIVRKCLEKDRENRYQSMREIVTDLRIFQRDSESGSLRATTSIRPTQVARKTRSRKAIDSLAILPLTNMGADPNTEYLSDGITESIINNLSQLPRLRVMARSTVFRYKGRDHHDAPPDPMGVGQELNVRAVMTGRVFEKDDRLIIKVELVDTSDGSQLWGEQYNRALSDIFAVEEEISREISEKLRLKLSGKEKRQLTKRHTENTQAYKLYLKGRYYWNKRTEEGLKKGIEHFEQAISTDPNYALAYAGLADSYIILAGYSSFLPNQLFPIGRVAATKALELDPMLAEAHVSMAAIRSWYEWDWDAGEKGYRRALELNPGYATAYQWLALNNAALGRVEEALSMIKRAQELDPLSVIINLNVARIYYFARRYDKALAACLQTIELHPNFALAHRRLGQIYCQMGMYEEAARELETAIELSEDDSESMSVLAYIHAVSGKRAETERLFDQIKGLAERTYVSPYSIARVYTSLGDFDSAFEWLEKTYQDRHGIVAYIKVEPAFDTLRNDLRFEVLLNRLGIAG